MLDSTHDLENGDTKEKMFGTDLVVAEIKSQHQETSTAVDIKKK